MLERHGAPAVRQRSIRSSRHAHRVAGARRHRDRCSPSAPGRRWWPSAASTRSPPAVEKLPRVGALLDPDTERILSLQAESRDRVRVAGGPARAVQAGGHPASSSTATAGCPTRSTRSPAIGAATGHAAGAATVVAGLRARLDGIRASGRRTRPAAHAAGHLSASRARCAVSTPAAASASCTICWSWPAAANVFADVREESVQPSQETLLTRRPDVVVELHPRADVADAAEARRAWSPLASMPAVRANRVHPLTGAYLVTAGPRLGDAAEAIAPRRAPRRVQVKILLSWSSGKDSAWALHVLQATAPRLGGGTAHDDQRGRAARRHARRASGRARGPGQSRESAASHRADSRSVLEPGVRGSHARGRGRGRGGGIHAHGVRRPVSRRRAALPRNAPREHRADADVSVVADADAAAGSGHDGRRACARGSPAWTRGSSTRRLPGASSTHRCSQSCRPAWTRAARTASSTPASTTGRCSLARSGSTLASRSHERRSPGAIS